MTAPVSVPLLDELEAARAAATPGPWVLAEWSASTILAQRYLDSLAAGEPEDRRPAFLHTTASNAADAACIVAEHNATGRLTAALRAVLTLAEEWSDPGLHAGIRNNADRLYAAVASALAEEEGR